MSSLEDLVGGQSKYVLLGSIGNTKVFCSRNYTDGYITYDGDSILRVRVPEDRKYVCTDRECFRVTENIIPSSIIYLDYKKIIMDGLKINSVWQLWKGVISLSAVGCSLSYISTNVRELDIRDNPIDYIEIGKCVNIKINRLQHITTCAARSFPTLQSVSAFAAKRRIGWRNTPQTKLLRKLTKLQECDLCHMKSICQPTISFGFMKCNICIYCAVIGHAPMFRVTVHENSLRFEQKKCCVRIDRTKYRQFAHMELAEGYGTSLCCADGVLDNVSPLWLYNIYRNPEDLNIYIPQLGATSRMRKLDIDDGGRNPFAKRLILSVPSYSH